MDDEILVSRPGAIPLFLPDILTNTMAAEVRRDSFKTFWDKYSDKPDTNSMMLNQTANDLEASDRAEILSSLPHLTNKDVVDIGAGIG
ncbi:hypothetical protein ANCDUO_06001 [Ancylostoma duodenale]|uniref:phosphoethanolamine N-methyltransferase n=1 Tax=Ancylostoma duodenale TaxID=51022 RepID=A0A0C2H2L9_9BILA|nr:hypothetical protein ANCDUO_06001 [Ancylostoma duodenale]